jgi:hypothetical protein
VRVAAPRRAAESRPRGSPRAPEPANVPLAPHTAAQVHGGRRTRCICAIWGAHPSLAYTRGQSGSVASATANVCRRLDSTCVNCAAGAGCIHAHMSESVRRFDARASHANILRGEREGVIHRAGCKVRLRDSTCARPRRLLTREESYHRCHVGSCLGSGARGQLVQALSLSCS